MATTQETLYLSRYGLWLESETLDDTTQKNTPNISKNRRSWREPVKIGFLQSHRNTPKFVHVEAPIDETFR